LGPKDGRSIGPGCRAAIPGLIHAYPITKIDANIHAIPETHACFFFKIYTHFDYFYFTDKWDGLMMFNRGVPPHTLIPYLHFHEAWMAIPSLGVSGNSSEDI